MNYTIRTTAGMDRVVHHNILKACVLTSGTGATHYLIPEAEGTVILFETTLPIQRVKGRPHHPNGLTLRG